VASYLLDFHYELHTNNQQFLSNTEQKDMLPIELYELPEVEADNRGMGGSQ